MSRSEAAIWILFSVAVAALAAAFGDVFVEYLSNRGVFGPGLFTDGSNADIVPATIAGLALLLTYVILRARQPLRTRPAVDPAWHRVVGALPAAAILRLLPLVFALQIATLWVMESSEQVFVVGHSFGGTVWLGGPVLISLGLHVVFCFATAFLVRHVAAALESRVVLICSLFRAAVSSIGQPRSLLVPFRVELSAALRSPALRFVGKRAPPIMVSR